MKEKLDSVTRNKLIDALLDLRLELSIKKITSPKIKKSELKVMIDEVNEKAKDKIVTDSINELFSEYFDNKVLNQNMSYDNEISNVSNLNDYKDGQAKTSGSSLVKRDGHFNSSKNDSSNAA